VFLYNIVSDQLVLLLLINNNIAVFRPTFLSQSTQLGYNYDTTRHSAEPTVVLLVVS